MFSFREFVDVQTSPSGAFFGRVVIENDVSHEIFCQPLKFMYEPTQLDVENFGRAYVADLNRLEAAQLGTA